MWRSSGFAHRPIRLAHRPMRRAHTAAGRLAMYKHIREAHFILKQGQLSTFALLSLLTIYILFELSTWNFR